MAWKCPRTFSEGIAKRVGEERARESSCVAPSASRYPCGALSSPSSFVPKAWHRSRKSAGVAPPRLAALHSLMKSASPVPSTAACETRMPSTLRSVSWKHVQRAAKSVSARPSGMNVADWLASAISSRLRIPIAPGNSTVSKANTPTDGTMRIPSSFPIRWGNAPSPLSSAAAQCSAASSPRYPITSSMSVGNRSSTDKSSGSKSVVALRGMTMIYPPTLVVSIGKQVPAPHTYIFS